jgi:hypothetical protein
MGAMFKVDCAWNGLRGTIEPLDEQGELELAELRERKSKSNGDNVSSFNKYGGAFK